MLDIFLLSILIISMTLGLFKLIIHFDNKHNLTLNRKSIAIILVLSILSSIWFVWIEPHKIYQFFYVIFAAYLITCAILDKQTKSVYDFLHLVAGLAGISLLILQSPDGAIIKGLVIFSLLQLLLFHRFYGLADCFTFIICAIYLAARGHDLLIYLLHMGATYLLLTIVQAFRHNINRKGNLKQPVALIPYIAATVWIFLQ